jgi:DNA-binding transcriptional ArsR family regulator
MDIFYVIAEPTRRHIVEMLAKKGRLSATDIGNKFSMSSPAISQHLKVLREADLVYAEKEGQQRMYQLNMDAIYEIERWTHKMTHLWNERFDKLDRILKVKASRQKDLRDVIR